MYRMRMMLLPGILGALGFGTASAQAQYVSVAAAVPSYAYAPSVAHYYSVPEVVPQPAPVYPSRYIYAAPDWSYQYPSLRSTRYRPAPAYDPTGRHDGLARPWLR